MNDEPMNQGWKRDDDRTAIHFRDLLKDHAGSSRAVDWGSDESQKGRFDALIKPLDLDGARILDVGCGQGDLLSFLQGRNLEVQYEGVDLTRQMIDLCRSRFPGTSFHHGSVLDLPSLIGDRFDYVIASGIFFLRQSEPMTFMENSIAAMFECARCAVSFNSLSNWNRQQSDGEFLADPIRVLEIARRFSPRIVFRHDYHPGDFTITIRRDRESR